MNTAVKRNKYPKDGNKVFVKYANRKLYDTQESKYVTLSDIAKLPLGSFVVLDQVTQQEITSEVLLSALTTYFQKNPARFEAVKSELVSRFLNN